MQEPTDTDDVPPEVQAEFDALLEDYAQGLEDALDEHFDVGGDEDRHEGQLAKVGRGRKRRG